jgi:death on curing protein
MGQVSAGRRAGRVRRVRRSSGAAAWTFMYINGIELGYFDVDDAEEFMNDVAAKGNLTIEYIASKLSEYIQDRSR